jgi:hypothetical protein
VTSLSCRGSSRLGFALSVLLFACVSPRGGWDVRALVAKAPSISQIKGQRIGDLLPFPALDGDRIALVACRFAGPARVRVGARDAQWPASWGEAALRSLNQGLAGVDLELVMQAGAVPDAKPEIEIVMIEAVGREGPMGLGDTLTECDVSPSGGQRDSPDASPRGAGEEVRGRLIGAKIRMRLAQHNVKGLVQYATAEEWVGAFMHELGHALGFSGHVAVGNSVLVRDESRIRALGRGALDGQAIDVPTLEALYRLRPGERLGSRPVRRDELGWLHAIDAFYRDRPGDEQGLRLISSVGDEAARLVWRDSAGRELAVRFPQWRAELRKGGAITLRPDRATRRLLADSGIVRP